MTEVFDDRTPWPSSARQPLTLAIIALAACAAYYAASVIGLQLRFAGATTSVLWPPNAVLTSVLLITPPRRWLLLLACVLPVHVLIQYPTGWPLPLIFTLFLTNCLEALIAAGGLYLLSDAPWRFDTVRRLMAFFIAAVLVAPVLSSFLDAGAVAWFRGEPYWPVWQMRTLSNILAELTVVPGVVGGVLLGLSVARGRAAPRAIEAGALTLALAGIGSLEFTSTSVASIGAVSSRAPFVLQLPLILWAAVRFGAAGAGLALLFTSVLTSWSVVHNVGPFVSMEPSMTVAAVQLSLIIVSATLMCLATLTEERRQTQHELSVRLQFESLLSQFSRALLELPSDQLSVAFEAWLGRIGPLIGVDALTLFVVPRDGEPIAREFAWTAPHVSLPPDAVLQQQTRWARQALDSRQLSADAEADAGALAAGGAVPLIGHGRVLGAMAYGAVTPGARAELPPNIWLLAEVVATALNRRRAESELRRAEVEAQRTREELAHVARVSTVGEMTASLAHQLNQPLTAIMTNAHAARRILARDAEESDEVRAILSDIVSDARRASDVIQHLRDFLRKGQLDMTRLSVSRVVHDVVDLARSEAIIREIDVSIDCPGAHYVRADRVQIQQVVLNLLHNAMDAVEQTNAGSRRIVIACRTMNGHALKLSVHDSGPGLEPGTEEVVFDPFYTTKRGGMGMGLSIVRSIVEAHGGTVRAVNDTGRGAVFEVTLPPYRSVAEH